MPWRRLHHSTERQDSQWRTVRTAPDQLTAEMWRGLLEVEGIPAMLAAGDAVSFLGVSLTPCRLLVPAELVPAAADLLDQQIAAGEGLE